MRNANEKDIKEISEHNRIVYIQEMDVLKRYYSLVENLTYKNQTKWQLYNSLMYPIYADFNHKVYRQFKEKILNGDTVELLFPVRLDLNV